MHWSVEKVQSTEFMFFIQISFAKHLNLTLKPVWMKLFTLAIITTNVTF